MDIERGMREIYYMIHLSKNAPAVLRPSVAVIIPYYNGSKWIERALISVFDQTVKPKEVIVVNDGSSLEEQSALAELSNHYLFIIINKTNGGQGSARNVGVSASTASYISFLDQDDFYLPNHIEDLVRALPQQDSSFGFVYANLHRGNEHGDIIQPNMLNHQKNRHPKHNNIIDLLQFDLYILPSASLISRETFDAIGGFDEQFVGYEDDDLFIRIILAGYRHYYINTSVTVWCIRENSVSKSIQMSRSRFKFFKKYSTTYGGAEEKEGVGDVLIARFKKLIIGDLTHAIKINHCDQFEYGSILQKVIGLVWMNQYDQFGYKVFSAGRFVVVYMACKLILFCRKIK